MRDIQIAVCGETRSGKSSVSEYFQKKLNMVRFGFGDELKKDFHSTYPHIPREPKPVRGYRLFGELQRFVKGNTVWIDKCFDRIDYHADIAKMYSWHGDIPAEERPFRPIIDDMRQRDEFEACVEKKFFTIRVEAPREIRRERMLAAGDKFTEADLDFDPESGIYDFEVDFVVNNNGTLAELYEQLDNITDILTGKA
ncbi:deoxynucleotide kinase [Bacillus phage 278BB001]|nr:deoxynucleotide kinase [Bacillus phage 043JT007]QZA70380.1 deoxynucleotide kinase [Bacillus phage 278BB001]